MFECVDSALTMAAAMSSRSPFFSPFDKRNAADEAKLHFMLEYSDPLTTVSAFNAWRDLRKAKRGKKYLNTFLNKNFLSQSSLFQIEELRRQFSKLMIDIGFLSKDFRCNNNESELGSLELIKGILCAGLYPNVIVGPRDLVRTSQNKRKAGECIFHNSLGDDVYLHPSTVAFSATTIPSRFCVYHEIVKSSKIYVRDCTPVGEWAILLFGGSFKLYHEKNLVCIDNHILFRMNAKIASILKHLRSCMEKILLKKIVSPNGDVRESEESRALMMAVNLIFESKEQLEEQKNLKSSTRKKSERGPSLASRKRG